MTNHPLSFEVERDAISRGKILSAVLSFTNNTNHLSKSPDTQVHVSKQSYFLEARRC